MKSPICLTITCIIALCLFGCATPRTTGSSKSIEVANSFKQSGNGNVLVVVAVNGKATGGDMGDVDQDSKQDGGISTPIDASLPINGLDALGEGVSSLGKSLGNIKGDIGLDLGKILNKDDTTVVPPKETPQAGSVRQGYTKMRKMGELKDGSPRIQAAYYFPKTAREYCGDRGMEFVWADGQSMSVKDTSKKYIADLNDGRKYQPGPDEDPREGKGVMVYAALGTKPAYVDMTCK